IAKELRVFGRVGGPAPPVVQIRLIPDLDVERLAVDPRQLFDQASIGVGFATVAAASRLQIGRWLEPAIKLQRVAASAVRELALKDENRLESVGVGPLDEVHGSRERILVAGQ